MIEADHERDDSGRTALPDRGEPVPPEGGARAEERPCPDCGTGAGGHGHKHTEPVDSGEAAPALPRSQHPLSIGVETVPLEGDYQKGGIAQDDFYENVGRPGWHMAKALFLLQRAISVESSVGYMFAGSEDGRIAQRLASQDLCRILEQAATECELARRYFTNEYDFKIKELLRKIFGDGEPKPGQTE